MGMGLSAVVAGIGVGPLDAAPGEVAAGEQPVTTAAKETLKSRALPGLDTISWAMEMKINAIQRRLVVTSARCAVSESVIQGFSVEVLAVEALRLSSRTSQPSPLKPR